MGGGLTGRDRELELAQTVLRRTSDGPTTLIVDGQAGIGKTTLCRGLAENLAASGFTILTTTGAAAEASLAWAGLADVLAGIDEAALSELSSLHRQTLQAVESGLAGSGGDERLVAAAFRAALEELSRRRPVLIVIDDAQWLDQSSRLVLGFAVRRLTGPVAMLVSLRTGDPGAADSSWLRPSDPHALNRLTLEPLSADAIDEIVSARLGRVPPQPMLQRIRELSGGNPFYALELLRALQERQDSALESLPPTLTGLIRGRIGELDGDTAEAMVAVAAAFEPTIAIVAAAIDRNPDELVEMLQPLESRGLLIFDGPRIRFTHPMIASSCTTGADPGELRRIHRRLAEVVTQPESRARHLALSTPYGDSETLAALDTAAESASTRGAFGTAAELIALAIRLGGDDQIRRLRGAEYYFRSGALDNAEDLLAPIIDELPAGFLRAVGLMLLAAVRGYREGIANTIGLFERAVHEAEDFAPLRTQALLLLSLATGIGGDMATCVRHARRARADADASGLPELQSQALSLWSHVSFMYGLGADTEALRAALEIEDPLTDAPVMLRPTPVYALNCAWTGRLDEGRTAMTEVWHRCEERGIELDALWATEQLTWIDVAVGRYADAERSAAEALRRAKHIGGRLPLITAHTAIAIVAAYQGRLEEARIASQFATESATEAGLGYLADPPLMSLAFAEVSDGQYEVALQTLKPLLEKFDPAHHTEIMAGAWLPDAIEALTAVGRTDEAEPLVAALEANGSHLDRPWMLAVGARGRALVLAVRGDLDGALQSAERAMEHHDRLPMPFERARTQFLIGQLHRRRRHVQAAHDNLSAAAAAFEEIGSPLWAARANDELARLTARSAGAALTDSEQRVAGLAASGLSNKEIAAKLYLSAKTVEMYLSNAYRKLGIRSRSQLADRLRDA